MLLEPVEKCRCVIEQPSSVYCDFVHFNIPLTFILKRITSNWLLAGFLSVNSAVKIWRQQKFGYFFQSNRSQYFVFSFLPGILRFAVFSLQRTLCRQKNNSMILHVQLAYGTRNIWSPTKKDELRTNVFSTLIAQRQQIIKPNRLKN